MSRLPAARTSADPTAERLAQLKTLFPEAFADGRFDADKLRAAVGDPTAASGPERFTFTWAGRAHAVACLQTPTRATLLPDPAASVDFDATRHAVIEGDNLEVLKLLYKPYAGRVKLIYIDPPYNTGQDFIYPDDFRDTLSNYLGLTGQADAAGNLLRSNPDTSGRYHSDWLSLMYPRLFLARQLLRDDGVLFISIDDHEVHHLRMLLNEVFGEENFVAQVAWQKVYGGGPKVKRVVEVHEYVVCYAKSLEAVPSITLPPDPDVLRLYKHRDEKYEKRGPYYTQPLATTSMDERANLRFPIIHNGEEVWPEKQWQWKKDRVVKAQANNELVFKKRNSGEWSVRYKQYLKDESGVERGSKPFSVMVGPYTQDGTEEVGDLLGDNKAFSFPKPVELVKHFLRFCWQDQDALVLDFFAGSGTTAQAVLELNHKDGGNRRFILVQLPEPTGTKANPTIAHICRERVRRVIGKLRAEAGDLTRTAPEDLGFKAFRLAESHFAQWSGVPERTPEAYLRQMRLIAEEPLRPGWTPAGLLWELALKEGYGLNSVLDTVDAGGPTVHRVTDPDKDPPQRLLACFDDRLPDDLARRLDLTADDLLFVRDAALTDTLAANLALQCRLRTI